MDRHLEIALVSALIAVLLGCAIVWSVRDGEYQSRISFTPRTTRSESPYRFWTGLGVVAALMAVMAYISIGSLLGWL
jgi:hypothetical protein